MTAIPAAAIKGELAPPSTRGPPSGAISAELHPVAPSTSPAGEQPPPPPSLPRAIPRTWWAGLAIVVAADLLFVVLSAQYGSLLEVDAVLAGAEVLLAIVAIAAIYAAIMFGRGG
jgi:hypothetical protein